MTTVINLSEVIVDDWVRYDRFRALGVVSRVLVSLDDLGRYPRYFERSLFQLGVELEADDEIDDIAGWLPRLDLVSLNFGAFADGRPFSQAKLLRDRFGYRGDIRAYGEVLRDQLSFMQRCGINQFGLAEGEDVELALGAFADISESYQPELVQLEPGQVANPH
jgi:uncharacterized protein (DUF934 family)